ncbi:mitochondrial carrier domain-containing protein [Tuber borchii]|uniref:Mitochondrial carrier domain-containing protein n=1 Tax=Tuber borchii TaxID=42251 RepID=A0A2T6ZBZ3_TUBBO|nr:mitochondrial carrier domain-containing protein [Tuber borchii]
MSQEFAMETGAVPTAAGRGGQAMGLAAAKDILFGSSAGMIGKIIEYPFDTVKVRLQSQPDDQPLRYRGPLDCFKQSLKQDGIRGLYRGISPPLVGAAAENSALFFSYNIAQNLLRKSFYPYLDKEGDLPIGALVFCGAASGAFTSFILTPVELIKCKMQVQTVGIPRPPISIVLPSSSASSSPPFGTGTSTAGIHTISPARLAGPITLLGEVYRVYGLKGLWHGQVGTFLRETGGSAAWFGSYEYISKTLRTWRGRSSNTAGEMMAAGAAAGVSYNFVLFPADSVKSRMQTEAIGMHGDKKGFAQVATGMYRASGIRGLYRGCGLTCMRSAPSSAVIFLVYESMKEYFG